MWVTLRCTPYQVPRVSFQGCITSHLPSHVLYCIFSIPFLQMHLFTFVLESPFCIVISFLLCIFSAPSHFLLHYLLPQQLLSFSACLSRGAMFCGSMVCFHPLPSQLDQPRAPCNCCPSNPAIHSPYNYLVKPKHTSSEISKAIMWLLYTTDLN